MDFISTKKKIALFGCHFSYQTKRLGKFAAQCAANPKAKIFIVHLLYFTLQSVLIRFLKTWSSAKILCLDLNRTKFLKPLLFHIPTLQKANVLFDTIQLQKYLPEFYFNVRIIFFLISWIWPILILLSCIKIFVKLVTNLIPLESNLTPFY